MRYFWLFIRIILELGACLVGYFAIIFISNVARAFIYNHYVRLSLIKFQDSFEIWYSHLFTEDIEYFSKVYPNIPKRAAYSSCLAIMVCMVSSYKKLTPGNAQSMFITIVSTAKRDQPENEILFLEIMQSLAPELCNLTPLTLKDASKIIFKKFHEIISPKETWDLRNSEDYVTSSMYSFCRSVMDKHFIIDDFSFCKPFFPNSSIMEKIC